MRLTLLNLRGLFLIAFSALALLQVPARAELTIEITGAGANRIPLAIADFEMCIRDSPTYGLHTLC